MTTTATTARPSRALSITLWVLQVLLAAAFVMSGLPKVTSPIAQLATQLPWVTDFPALLVRFIGVAEIAGALGLLLPSLFRIRPSLTPLAALGLVVVMLLASALHLTRGETMMLPVNLLLAALAGFVAWGRSRKVPIQPRRSATPTASFKQPSSAMKTHTLKETDLMKAARLQAYGDIDQFKIGDIPTPVPGPEEVLIKVEASAVNHLDLYIRQGYVAQMFPLDLPAILGGDAAGTIEAVGAKVTGFAAGDRVIAHLGVNGKGSHAEYTVAPAAGVAKLPDSVSFEQGAALPLSGLTGRQAVDALGVKPGERVLVGGALGAVGRAAVGYLRELGAIPVAGVRLADLEEGRTLAGEAIDIDKTPQAASFDYAVAASQATVANTVAHVRDGGKIAGAVQGPENANPSVTYEMIMHHDDPAHLQALADAAGRGDLVIPVAATFSLEQLGEAHAALAAGARGKVVVLH